jgi:lipopolysaccharide transport system permease protein
MFCLAVVWVLSAVAVIVPDIAQITNILLLLLMFVSPIAFSIDMAPARARPLIYLNPLTFLIEGFRYALIGIRSSPLWYDTAFLLASTVAAAMAVTFFRGMSPVFSDYE